MKQGAHLTKLGWSKPHTHSKPTNLALFRHKITLYRFNQGAHTIAGGSNGSRVAEPPGLLTLTTGPGLQVACGSVESSKSDPWQKAAFLAAAARRSGDWLLALPIASCLRLDDEAVRVVVALRLGLRLCAACTYLSAWVTGGYMGPPRFRV